jgi:hypothetical protein
MALLQYFHLGLLFLNLVPVTSAVVSITGHADVEKISPMGLMRRETRKHHSTHEAPQTAARNEMEPQGVQTTKEARKLVRSVRKQSSQEPSVANVAVDSSGAGLSGAENEFLGQDLMRSAKHKARRHSSHNKAQEQKQVVQEETMPSTVVADASPAPAATEDSPDAGTSSHSSDQSTSTPAPTEDTVANFIANAQGENPLVLAQQSEAKEEKAPAQKHEDAGVGAYVLEEARKKAFYIRLPVSGGKQLCLTEDDHEGYGVRAKPCRRNFNQQRWFWMGSKLMNLFSDDRCLGMTKLAKRTKAGKNKLLLSMSFDCSDESAPLSWGLDKTGRLKSNHNEQCMAIDEGADFRALALPCDEV